MNTADRLMEMADQYAKAACNLRGMADQQAENAARAALAEAFAAVEMLEQAATTLACDMTECGTDQWRRVRITLDILATATKEKP